MARGGGSRSGSRVRCESRRRCRQRINIATLLLLLSWGVGGGVAMPGGLAPPPPQFQDPASLQNWDEVAVAEIREHLANADPQEREQRMAMLYQLIKQYMAEAGAAGDAGETRMAIPPPLLHSAGGGLRAHPGHQLAGAGGLVAGGVEEGADEDLLLGEEIKPKRVSSAYMSLCHFKICNMGRKRNYRNQWGRV
ncbi:uncharacterized protein CNMa isoform X2 [Hetaerina americana]